MEQCLAYGAVIAILVSILKRIPAIGYLVSRFPTVIAGLGSFILVTLRGKPAGTPEEIAIIVGCALLQLGGAVATHQWMLEPVAKRFGVHISSRRLNEQDAAQHV